jgi:hypothetical protein
LQLFVMLDKQLPIQLTYRVFSLIETPPARWQNRQRAQGLLLQQVEIYS